MSVKLEARDLHAVKSRIAWSAVFGGFFVVVVVLTLLSTLESAIRISVLESGKNFNPQSLAQPNTWRNIAGFIALFAGGWVTSQSVARETKTEAAFYGVILWGLSFMSLLFLAMNGIAWSLSDVMGINQIIQSYISSIELKDMANAMGLTPQQYEVFQELMKDRVSSISTAAASWWSFAGVTGSLIATILGSVVGSGPSLPQRETTIIAGIGPSELKV